MNNCPIYNKNANLQRYERYFFNAKTVFLQFSWFYPFHGIISPFITIFFGATADIRNIAWLLTAKSNSFLAIANVRKRTQMFINEHSSCINSLIINNINSGINLG